MLNKNKKNIHNYAPQEILRELMTSQQDGLSVNEALARVKEYGRNQIEQKHNWRWLKLVVNQFNDALVWILLVASGLAALFQEWRDVTIILFIVGINSVIGFIQEFKAERILDSIKKLTTDKAVVIRSGVKTEINSTEIVPGDVVYLASGDRVPADGYILESYDFKINSFIFTGESKPELKFPHVITEKNVPLADIDNMVFMGETVSTGEGVFVVTGIGMNTELGKIADLTHNVKDEITPLQNQMRTLGRNVAVLSVSIGILVMIAGQYFEMSLYSNFLFALALAVSVVPEGLPAAVLVALSLGMKRLLKDNVLAKKLTAVETLGSVSVICTDKTGTITKNELTVTKVIVNHQEIEVSGSGYQPEGDFLVDEKTINYSEVKNLELLFRIGTLCNDASVMQENNIWKIVGDPTEGAIIVAGKKYNSKDKYFELGEKKITENPFSSERMRMSVIYKNEHINSFVKGSPDVMLELCDYIKIEDKVIPFAEQEKEKVRKMYNKMSAEALRVLGFAYRNMKDVAPEKYSEEAENKLIWVGMMAMIDPAREDVTEAIVECRDLGIKVMMITGDYEVTARAIAKNIGMIGEKDNGDQEVISGSMLNKLRDKEIYEKIKNGVCVFARIAPEQKLRIATILKNNKQTIAMTGDGVNDAPALKKADIGVAMGIIGTDVSKEAADMILMNDNFASIVKGIKEGRTIYQNLKKFVHYVFTSNASELFSVIFGVLLQIPAPITAVQILSIDLATDIFPSFSLSLEPPEPNSDHSKVNNSKQHIMGYKGFRRILYVGIIMAIGGVGAFLWSMIRGGWWFGQEFDVDSALYIKSTTVTYAVLAMTQMANLLHSRSEIFTPFELGFFKNKYAIGSIFISIGILLSFMYVPLFQKYLHMMPIDGKDWMMVIVSVLAVYLLESGRKETNK